MFGLTNSIRVFLAVGPVDLRKKKKRASGSPRFFRRPPIRANRSPSSVRLPVYKTSVPSACFNINFFQDPESRAAFDRVKPNVN